MDGTLFLVAKFSDRDPVVLSGHPQQGLIQANASQACAQLRRNFSAAAANPNQSVASMLLVTNSVTGHINDRIQRE
jgi:hypothetical protein